MVIKGQMNPPARFTDVTGINAPTLSYPRCAGWGCQQVTYTPTPLVQSRFEYITRTNLLNQDSCPTESLDQRRIEAERNWLEHTTYFRESLTESLMRRKNWDQAQRRAAPKYDFF